MERLTIRNGDGSVSQPTSTTIEDVFYRLAEIEDILGYDYDLDRLRELALAVEEDRGIIPPVTIGEKVYHITACKYFPQVLDGTLYGADGGHGDATGLYCPCELSENCPFPCEEDGIFDCNKHKNTLAVFEDVVKYIVVGDTFDFIGFQYSGAANFDAFGKYVFPTREAAEAVLNGENHG